MKVDPVEYVCCVGICKDFMGELLVSQLLQRKLKDCLCRPRDEPVVTT